MTTRLESRKSFRVCSILATRLLFLVLLLVVVCDCYAKTTASRFDPREYETVDVNDSEHGQLRLLQKSQPLHDALGVSYQLEFVLEKPRAFRLMPEELEGAYGDYDLRLQYSDAEDVDETNDRTVLRYLLVPNAATTTPDDNLDTIILPALTFGFELSSDVADADSLAPIFLQSKPIHGTPNSVDVAPRDISQVQPNVKPIRTLRLALWMIGTLVLALLVLATRLFRNRNVAEITQVHSEQPQEPPYDKALRRLKELENSAVYHENRREFYTDLDQIVRCYFAEEGLFNAEELTTQEIMRLVDAQPLSLLETICDQRAALLSLNLSQESATTELQRRALQITPLERSRVFLLTLQREELRRELYATLQTLDLVKFARRQVSSEDAKRLLASSQQMIHLVDTYFHANLDTLEQRWRTKLLQSHVDTSPVE